jgi:hypothetical protein
MELAILIWIVCGIGSAFVAQSRGADGCLWFGLGVVFGPFGLAFAFLSGGDRKCPHCRERVHPKATRCPKCQADTSTQASPTQQSSSPAQSGTYRCPKCKTPVEVGQSICGGCGGRVGWAGTGAEKKCPDCAEMIKAEARKCRLCGCLFDAAAAPQPTDERPL